MKRFSNIVDKNKKKNMIGISCITASAIIISSAIIFSFPNINFASIQEDMINNEVANNTILEENIVEGQEKISENTVTENVIDNSVTVEDNKETESEVTNKEDTKVAETKETKLTYAVTNEETGKTKVVTGDDEVSAEENNNVKTVKTKVTDYSKNEVIEEYPSDEEGNNTKEAAAFPELIFPVGDINDIVAGFFGYEKHSGIDFKAEEGTPIKASDSGKVIYSGYKGSYGNLVIIEHNNGTQTYYAHCSELKISMGENVNVGDIIATVGATGNATGPNLHFELRINGNPVNPIPYFK